MAVRTDFVESSQTLVIYVPDRFDFSQHNDFRRAYEETPFDIKAYSIDFTDTTALDSSALGMLLLLRDYAGGDASDISLTHVSDQLKQLLSISSFDKLFKIA